MYFLHDSHLHIHLPETAIIKDSACAGIAVTTALISLANGQGIREVKFEKSDTSCQKYHGKNCCNNKCWCKADITFVVRQTF
ncbi:Lon protease-like protein, mitochondrial [Formica fusca]